MGRSGLIGVALRESAFLFRSMMIVKQKVSNIAREFGVHAKARRTRRVQEGSVTGRYLSPVSLGGALGDRRTGHRPVPSSPSNRGTVAIVTDRPASPGQGVPSGGRDSTRPRELEDRTMKLAIVFVAAVSAAPLAAAPVQGSGPTYTEQQIRDMLPPPPRGATVDTRRVGQPTGSTLDRAPPADPRVHSAPAAPGSFTIPPATSPSVSPTAVPASPPR
jgi:hypothetical protein